MCCDSPSPPPPDPLIGQAAQANVELGREALEFQKKIYEENKPRQEQLDRLTSDLVRQYLDIQGASAEDARRYVEYLRNTFWPVEQSLAREAMEFDTEARRRELAALAGADVEQAAGVADAAARRDAARYGINPSDAAFAENLAGSAYNKTLAKIGAMNAADRQARAEGRALRFDVAGLSRGLPAAGVSATQAALAASGGALTAGQVPAANVRADAMLMNQGYGTAITGNQSAGNLMLGQYQGQLSAYNAEQQAQGGLFQGLGTLGGLVLSKWVSSENAKRDKQPVDEEKMLEGLQALPTTERWRYKPGIEDGGRVEHVGPYAEDVREVFGDAAAPGGAGLDLVTMNGITVAAVKALADKVERLEKTAGLSAARTKGKARDTEPRRKP